MSDADRDRRAVGHRGLHAGDGRLLPRVHPLTLLAFAWASIGLRQVRRQHRHGMIPGSPLPPPPLPDSARRGVLGLLRRSNARCLESAVLLRRWERAHGTDRDLVIGVTAPKAGFAAHAWLDGDPPCCSVGFVELTRR